jgi:hypothetical protein
VGDWPDLSGQSNPGLQSSSGLRPTTNLTGSPNGFPAVTFSGGQLLTCSGSLAYSSASLLILCKTNGSSVPVCYGSGRYLFLDGIYPRAILATNSGSLTAGGYTDGAWHCWEAHFSGSSSSLVLDGSILASGTLGEVWTPALIGQYTGGAFPVTGQIAELVVCSPALGSTDLGLLRTYLGTV